MSRRGTLATVALLLMGLLPLTADAGEKLIKADDITKALSGQRTKAPLGDKDLKLSFRSARVTAKTVPKIDIPIRFATLSARLDPRSLAQIKEIAIALRQLDLEQSRVLVIGHTDSRGEPAFNMALSRQRAQSVVLRLTDTHGIATNLLRPLGKGESQLKVKPERNASDLAVNRRVELRIVPRTD